VTDFVVSKVAVVICALLVLTVMSEATGRDSTLVAREALGQALDGLCKLAESMCLAGGEAVAVWTVPSLPSGAAIKVTITSDLVRGESEGHQVLRRPPWDLHTWSYDGAELNESMVADLDLSSAPVHLGSGECLTVMTRLVLLNDENRLMVFAS
jgi:hypothetical protein